MKKDMYKSAGHEYLDKFLNEYIKPIVKELEYRVNTIEKKVEDLTVKLKDIKSVEIKLK